MADMYFGTGRRGWLAGLVVLLIAAPAAAHLHVTSPQSRGESLKQGPCGGGPDQARGDVVHTFRPGQTITVEWDEFVDHPGHFRVAFDADGQDLFVDPAGFDDEGGGPGVLIDGIADKDGGIYSVEVTLPNVECDNCTLQVIQVMSDKPPYGDGNDLYYQCVDLVLSATAVPEENPPDSLDDQGCGCAAGSTGGAGLLALLGLLGLRRRRG